MADRVEVAVLNRFRRTRLRRNAGFPEDGFKAFQAGAAPAEAADRSRRQRQQVAPGQKFGGLPVVRGEETAERPVQCRGLVFLKQQRECLVPVGRADAVSPAVQQIGDHLVFPELEGFAVTVEKLPFFQATPDRPAGGERGALPPEHREIQLRIAADSGVHRVKIADFRERFVVLQASGNRGEHAEILRHQAVIRRNELGTCAAAVGTEEFSPDRPGIEPVAEQAVEYLFAQQRPGTGLVALFPLAAECGGGVTFGFYSEMDQVGPRGAGFAEGACENLRRERVVGIDEGDVFAGSGPDSREAGDEAAPIFGVGHDPDPGVLCRIRLEYLRRMVG